MIHWGWLIPAFMAGGLAGVALMCMMAVASDGDDALEARDQRHVSFDTLPHGDSCACSDCHYRPRQRG